jgi:hypothetical protein
MAACNRDMERAEMQHASSKTPTNPSQPWSFRQAIGRFMIDTVDWAEENRRMLAAGSLVATAGKKFEPQVACAVRSEAELVAALFTTCT